MNSKYSFKTVFFYPFYASIFLHVLFLRTIVEMVFMGMHSIVQNKRRFYIHFYKVVVIKYPPSGYVSTRKVTCN